MQTESATASAVIAATPATASAGPADPPIAVSIPITTASRFDIAAWILAGLTLIFLIPLHLLPALLVGLLVYDLTHALVPLVRLGRFTGYRARVAAVALLAITVAVLVGLVIFGMLSFLRNGNESVPVLLDKMASILEDSRESLPAWVVERIPTTAEGLKLAAVEWLKDHSSGVQAAGKSAGLFLTHLLLGMVIGAMVSLRDAKPTPVRRPLADAMSRRVERLADSFQSIVFAQVRISALNTVFTGLYLAVLLPLLGIHLPLTKTLIAVTFVAGLMPVIGNLISNVVIVVVSLSHSLSVAVGSLVFLVVIHKLEYFFNAKIIGSKIRAEPWELLTAMLVMESIFGMPGIIAAPIYYAYLKRELTDQGLV